MMRVRFRQVINRLLAEVFQADNPVAHLVGICRDTAVERRQLLRLATAGDEADFALKDEARTTADAQAVHLLDGVLFPAALAVGQGREELRGDTTVAVQFG